MESNIDNKPTIMRDINGKVLGTKRQNPPAKPVIKKPLTVDGKQVFNITELMRKRQSGEILSDKENKVLDRYLETSQQARNYFLRKENSNNKIFTESAKTEFPPKPYPTAGDRYLQQQQEKIRQFENSVSTKSTGYRPLDNSLNTKKGGFERAIDKMHQLGETKAELAERSAKIAKKFAKLLEFCKKYGKSIKA